MKLLILGSILYLSIGCAFGAGYYEGRVAHCDEASMRRAMDAATARTGAGITVVKCDSGVRERVATSGPTRVRYVQVARPVEYVDLGCDCNAAYYSAPVGCCL